MRLITRGDTDGLTCAVLLGHILSIDDIMFVHPKDMQDGKAQVTNNDVIANLPYHPNCKLWFDHHITSLEAAEEHKYEGKFALAPSAARVIFDYYLQQFPQIARYARLVEETDKMDSAKLSVEDVTNPKGYMLLFYTLDPRSGLGAFQDYFRKLVNWVSDKEVDEILDLPEVRERCQRLLKEQDDFKKILEKHSRKEVNVIITDLRGMKNLPAGNRFLVYTLYPECNVEMRLFDGKNNEFVVCAVGHSIFNRTCRTDIGRLLSDFGGGGHTGAGTCQLPFAQAQAKIDEIIKLLKEEESSELF